MRPPHQHRARVNYGSEFIYTSFDATGYHFNDYTGEDPSGLLRNIDCEVCSGNLLKQLHRVQAVNYGFQTNYIEINEYGRLARVGAVTAESPNVTIDLEYYIADGYNEQNLGFITDGEISAFSKYIINQGRVGQNFFIVTVPYGHNVVNFDFARHGEDVRVVGVGNAYLSQYAVTAQLGQVPKARASFEAFNMRSYTGYYNLPIPSINPLADCSDNVKFSIPDAYEKLVYGTLTGMEQIQLSQGVGGIMPNALKISLSNNALISEQEDKNSTPFDGSAHIQGFTINVPLGSTKVSSVGKPHSFHRAYNFPLRIEVEVQALVSELKEGKLGDLHCKKGFDIILEMYDCMGVGVCANGPHPSPSRVEFIIKNAILDTEGFSLDVQDSKVVDLKFHAQITGPEDTDSGFFMRAKSYLPDKPNIVTWGNPL